MSPHLFRLSLPIHQLGLRFGCVGRVVGGLLFSGCLWGLIWAVAGLAALGAAMTGAVNASDAVSRVVARMLRGMMFPCGFCGLKQPENE